jgi:hypothetical protein
MRKQHSIGLESICSKAQLGEDKILQYQYKINKYRRDCGCALGGVFLIVGAAFFTAYVVVTRYYRLQAIPIGLGIIFGSAIAGKIIGIGTARIKLFYLLRLLRARTIASKPNQDHYV